MPDAQTVLESFVSLLFSGAVLLAVGGYLLKRFVGAIEDRQKRAEDDIAEAKRISEKGVANLNLSLQELRNDLDKEERERMKEDADIRRDAAAKGEGLGDRFVQRPEYEARHLALQRQIADAVTSINERFSAGERKQEERFSSVERKLDDSFKQLMQAFLQQKRGD